MSKVFIPQMPIVRGIQHNVKDAERFGTLVTVFRPEDPHYRHEVFADNADERMPNLMLRAHEMMYDFDPNADYLALTGGSFFITLCLWTLSRLTHVKVLRYDRKESSYYPIILPTPQRS